MKLEVTRNNKDTKIQNINNYFPCDKWLFVETGWVFITSVEDEPEVYQTREKMNIVKFLRIINKILYSVYYGKKTDFIRLTRSKKESYIKFLEITGYSEI